MTDRRPGPPLTTAFESSGAHDVPRERTVAVRSGDVVLGASLALPQGEGPFPGCLLLSGSGPLDRNSNLPGQRLDIAGALASALADAGVATLRYDKRGVGASSGDHLTASFDDEVADAVAALETLRACDETTRRAAVIGHSVGATIALRLSRHAPPPDAFVLLAGAAQSGEQVMAWQSRRIGETQPIPIRWLRRFVERRQAADRRQLLASRTPTLRLRRQTLPAAWFRGYMAHDPSGDLSGIDRPVLAITGRKDVQVDSADVAAVGELVAGPFDGDTPAELTHLLRRDDGPPGLASYPTQLERPPDRHLIDRVATWTAARLG